MSTEKGVTMFYRTTLQVDESCSPPAFWRGPIKSQSTAEALLDLVERTLWTHNSQMLLMIIREFLLGVTTLKTMFFLRASLKSHTSIPFRNGFLSDWARSPLCADGQTEQRHYCIMYGLLSSIQVQMQSCVHSQQTAYEFRSSKCSMRNVRMFVLSDRAVDCALKLIDIDESSKYVTPIRANLVSPIDQYYRACSPKRSLVNLFLQNSLMWTAST